MLTEHSFCDHIKAAYTAGYRHALQGDLRFVMTVKGSRILLSVKSAAEELKPVLAEANDFSLLSFKVPCSMNVLGGHTDCAAFFHQTSCLA